MKVFKFILIFFLVSCSRLNEEQKKSAIEALDSLTIDRLLTKKEGVEKEITTGKKLELKEKIDRYFGNIEKMTGQNEYGGGDCWDTFKEYKTKLDGFYAIEDRMDCGDYGFTRFRLIQSKDKRPEILEKITKEWLVTDSIPYLMKEWIVEFSDTSKIYYRELVTGGNKIFEIPDSVRFSLEIKEDLNVNEAITSINDSRTAKND